VIVPYQGEWQEEFVRLGRAQRSKIEGGRGTNLMPLYHWQQAFQYKGENSLLDDRGMLGLSHQPTLVGGDDGFRAEASH
jgi:hypothetical protein